MSRNRNVRKKLDNAKITNNSCNTTILVPRNADYLGGTRTWRNAYENRNICESINNNSSKIQREFYDQLSAGKSSSSSSLSWAEDCEADATKHVNEEYERMLRVLQRLEPIPSHYDKDEYKLWIKTFPCLSLIDRNSSSSKILVNSEENYRFSNLKSESRDLSTSLENDSVIEYSFSIPKDIEPKKLLRNRSVRNKETFIDRKINTTLNPMLLEEELFSFLTISIRPETGRTSISNKFNKHHSGARKSVIREGDKFHSLPPLISSAINDTYKEKSSRKSFAYRKTDSSQFLPVLETNYNGKFRSISAVPREFLHVSKCPSALPINNRGVEMKKFAQDVPSKQRKRSKDVEKKIINEFAVFD